MKTWKVEILVVTAILIVVNLITDRLFSIEVIAALAVVLSFGHTQIAERMAEKQSVMDKPTVECYRKMWFYFLGKEVCWFSYFLMNHSYSALVGVFVFLAYPFWRRLYRTRIKAHG